MAMDELLLDELLLDELRLDLCMDMHRSTLVYIYIIYIFFCELRLRCVKWSGGGGGVSNGRGGVLEEEHFFVCTDITITLFFLLLLCLVNVGHILQLFHNPFFMGFYVCFSFSMGWAAWSAVEV